MLQQLPLEWSTDHVPPEDRIDAMEVTLERFFRRWDFSTQAEPAAFQAQLRRHDFAGASIVRIAADPCVGQLPSKRKPFDEEPYLALQVNLSGSERVQMLEWDEQFHPGEMFLWRTDLRQRFDMLERTHCVSLMIPWQLMREHLPTRMQSPPKPVRFDSRTGVGAVLARHLLVLAKEIDTVQPSAHATLCRTAIELLSIALPTPESATKFKAMALLRERVLDYIAVHLRKDDLSPAQIAAAHGISLRYLHALFAQSDTTVVGHILESRLQACRQALADPAHQHLSISEIAFCWGFNSTSHFCRTFKQRYGVSPGEMRRMAAH